MPSYEPSVIPPLLFLLCPFRNGRVLERGIFAFGAALSHLLGLFHFLLFLAIGGCGLVGGFVNLAGFDELSCALVIFLAAAVTAFAFHFVLAVHGDAPVGDRPHPSASVVPIPIPL